MNPQARRYALLLILVVLLGAVAASVAAVAEASVKPAGPAKPYPVPAPCHNRQCQYVADDRCEIDDPDYPVNGKTMDAYRMLVGYPEFVVNRRGQFHVRSIEYLGYNEWGQHHWDRVEVYVRIPGTKAHKSQRVTPIYSFVPGGVKGGRYVGRDNGWTARGLEVVFTGYDRGRSCEAVVSPLDVPFAQDSVR